MSSERKDFRPMERMLIETLEAAGVSVVFHSGDAFAVVGSIDDCRRPERCGAGVGPYGKIECADCESECRLNANFVTLDITKLAQRLTDG